MDQWTQSKSPISLSLIETHSLSSLESSVVETQGSSDRGVQLMKHLLKQGFHKILGAKNWLIAFYILIVLVLSMTAKAAMPSSQSGSVVEVVQFKQDFGYLIVQGVSHTLCLEPLKLKVNEVLGSEVRITLADSLNCSTEFIETPFETAISINSLGLIPGEYHFVVQGPEGEVISQELIVQVSGGAEPGQGAIAASGLLRLAKGGVYELATDRGVYQLYSEIIDLNKYLNRNVVVLIKESLHHVGPVFEIAQDPLPSLRYSSGPNEMFYYALGIKLM